MKKDYLFSFESGQALVSLLFFVIIASAIVTSAVIVLVLSLQSTGRLEQGTEVYYTAENGIENAILRLMRNPDYESETLTLNDNTIEIVVSGSPTEKTITSTAKAGGYVRKIQADVTYNTSTNIWTTTSWKEVFN